MAHPEQLHPDMGLGMQALHLQVQDAKSRHLSSKTYNWKSLEVCEESLQALCTVKCFLQVVFPLFVSTVCLRHSQERHVYREWNQLQ